MTLRSRGTSRQSTDEPSPQDTRDISSDLAVSAQAAGTAQRYAALQAVIDRAVELGLADRISITEIRPDGLMTRLSTDDSALLTDNRQYDLNEGPCVQATRDMEANVVASGDTARDARWPTWGPFAARHGCVAIISAPLFTTGRKALGAVNLFHHDQRTLTHTELAAAKVLATHASLALAAGQHDENLWHAVDGRHVIGMAQGVLMNRFDLDDEEAFAFLRRLSQASNTKLHLIAEQIVTTRSVPGVDS